MAQTNMEVTVSIDKVCNDALFEFAENFYKKTGVRLRHVDFDWRSAPTIDAPGHFLLDVTVTSIGSGKP